MVFILYGFWYNYHSLCGAVSSLFVSGYFIVVCDGIIEFYGCFDIICVFCIGYIVAYSEDLFLVWFRLFFIMIILNFCYCVVVWNSFFISMSFCSSIKNVR